MLDQLFSSQTRLKLLTLFLKNPEKQFYVRELTRLIDERINSVRRELENLSGIGLLKDTWVEKRRYYSVDKTFEYYPELKALILKASTMPRKKIAELFEKAGSPDLVVLSGKFTQSPSKVDIMLVGTFSKAKLKDVIEVLQEEQDAELNYTVMDAGEFKFRKEYGDRFVRSVFENDHTVIIDNLDDVPEVAEKPVKAKTKVSFF